MFGRGERGTAHTQGHTTKKPAGVLGQRGIRWGKKYMPILVIQLRDSSRLCIIASHAHPMHLLALDSHHSRAARNLSYRHAHAQPFRHAAPHVRATQPSTHKPSSASPIASLSQRRRSTASRQKQQHACKGRSGSPRGQPSSHSGVAHHTRVRRSTSHAQARAGTYCHVRHEGLCSAARGRQRLSGLLSHGSSRARAHAQAQHHHHWSIRIGPSGELHFTHTNAHTSQQKHSQYLTTMTIPNLTTRHASTPSSAKKPVTNTKPTTSTVQLYKVLRGGRRSVH
jgi:hypothetical protein